MFGLEDSCTDNDVIKAFNDETADLIERKQARRSGDIHTINVKGFAEMPQGKTPAFRMVACP